MQKFGHKHFNLGKSIFSIYATINICVEDLDGVDEGESREDIDDSGGGCGEGAGIRCGPDGGWGGNWQGANVDPTVVEAVRHQGVRGGGAARSVDPAAVREVVSEVPAWTQQQSGRCWHGTDGGGGG
jgi:hypothetical protein